MHAGIVRAFGFLPASRRKRRPAVRAAAGAQVRSRALRVDEERQDEVFRFVWDNREKLRLQRGAYTESLVRNAEHAHRQSMASRCVRPSSSTTRWRGSRRRKSKEPGVRRAARVPAHAARASTCEGAEACRRGRHVDPCAAHASGISKPPGTDFAPAATVLPRLLGHVHAFGGLVGAASTSPSTREDGTLVRAKATPHRMLGYLVGKIVMFALTTLVSIIAIARCRQHRSSKGWSSTPGVPAARTDRHRRDGLHGAHRRCARFCSRSRLRKPSRPVFLPTGLLIYPSGIFTPITTLPTWLQWVGPALPCYWVGLGARSALLPAEMVAAGIEQSSRTLQMFAVLGAWQRSASCSHRAGCAAWPSVRRDPTWPRRESASRPRVIEWGKPARSSTTASRCCAPNAVSRGAALSTRSACTRDDRRPRTRGVQPLAAPRASHRRVLRGPY